MDGAMVDEPEWAGMRSSPPHRSPQMMLCFFIR